jgi:hypothetical protein
MKAKIIKEIEGALGGNTSLVGVEVFDNNLKVYLESDILSSFGESPSPNILVKLNEDGKVTSDFSNFDFSEISHLPFRVQLRGVSDFFESVDKVFSLIEDNKHNFSNLMKNDDEKLRSNVRRLKR